MRSVGRRGKARSARRKRKARRSGSGSTSSRASRACGGTRWTSTATTDPHLSRSLPRPTSRRTTRRSLRQPWTRSSTSPRPHALRPHSQENRIRQHRPRRLRPLQLRPREPRSRLYRHYRRQAGLPRRHDRPSFAPRRPSAARRQYRQLAHPQPHQPAALPRPHLQPCQRTRASDRLSSRRSSSARSSRPRPSRPRPPPAPRHQSRVPSTAPRARRAYRRRPSARRSDRVRAARGSVECALTSHRQPQSFPIKAPNLPNADCRPGPTRPRSPPSRPLARLPPRQSHHRNRR